MADYYDMQEVMDKLRKTEDEVQELVKQGQLRQYLDDGKPVFKTEDVDNLAEEIVGLDITAFGADEEELELDLGETSALPADESAEPQIAPDEIPFEETSEIELEATGEQPQPEAEPQTPALEETSEELKLEETSEILLTPDEDEETGKAGPDDLELDLEPDLPQKESEGGFGLSQMGDLTSADTNVGTLGINILSGTGDAYKLTEDTKAETTAEDIDDIDSLDADANLESLGSGSGLLDLSLQADDTSLGAVLDDILPAGAEGGDVAAQVGGIDEAADLLAEPEPLSADAGPAVAEVPSAEPMMAAPSGAKMVAIAPVDPKTNIFGVMMVLPVLGLILLAIVLTAAAQGVVPSIVKTIIETEIAGINSIWIAVGALSVLVLLIPAFAAVAGGGGRAKTKTKKAKKEKKPKEKKPPKPKKEKKAKKRK